MFSFLFLGSPGPSTCLWGSPSCLWSPSNSLWSPSPGPSKALSAPSAPAQLPSRSSQFSYRGPPNFLAGSLSFISLGGFLSSNPAVRPFGSLKCPPSSNPCTAQLVIVLYTGWWLTHQNLLYRHLRASTILFKKYQVKPATSNWSRNVLGKRLVEICPNHLILTIVYDFE